MQKVPTRLLKWCGFSSMAFRGVPPARFGPALGVRAVDPSEPSPCSDIVRGACHFFQRAPSWNPIAAAPASVANGCFLRDFWTRGLACRAACCAFSPYSRVLLRDLAGNLLGALANIFEPIAARRPQFR